jgi:hypothetical protein
MTFSFIMFDSFHLSKNLLFIFLNGRFSKITVGFHSTGGSELNIITEDIALELMGESEGVNRGKPCFFREKILFFASGKR